MNSELFYPAMEDEKYILGEKVKPTQSYGNDSKILVF